MSSIKPRTNASNNLNGDELHKVHGAEGGFFCRTNCAACNFQLKNQAIEEMNAKVNPIETWINANKATIETEKFNWLIDHLLPPNPAKVKGCELIFPDTAFFE